MTARRLPTILCAGIAVLDEIFQVASFPSPQAKTRATAYMAVTGGCAANAAIAIARLGGRARLAAPLGGPAQEDLIGERILAGLEKEGIDCSAVVRVAGVWSPVSAVTVDDAGERTIVNHRDERLSAARIGDPTGLVGDADAILVDNRFPEFVLPICEAARRRGIPVVLDGDEPTRQTDALLTASTHVVFSAEGLHATARRDDLADALMRIADKTQAFLAVTDGANDILWLDQRTIRRLPVFHVEAIDTLAAGDVFHGAIALALAEGVREEKALRFAAAAAAVKCTRLGGGAGAPTRAEVEAFLNAN